MEGPSTHSKQTSRALHLCREHPPSFLMCADYGFEYSDEEPEEEDVDIENQYYNSKGKLHKPHFVEAGCRLRTTTRLCPACAGMLEGDDPQEALDGFRQVVTMEQDKGEWCAPAADIQEAGGIQSLAVEPCS